MYRATVIYNSVILFILIFSYFSPFFQISPKIEKEKGKLLVYDPVTFNKNITKNAYLSEKILVKFKNCFDYLHRIRMDFRKRTYKSNLNASNVFKEMFT